MSQYQPPRQRTVYKASVPITLAWLVLSIGVCAMGVLFILLDEIFPLENWFYGLPVAVLGAANTTVFLRDLIRGRAALILYHDGLTVPNHTHIYWHEVFAVRITTRKYIDHLEIWVHDPNPILERMPQPQRAVRSLFWRTGYAGLTISNVQLHPHTPSSVVRDMLTYNPRLHVAPPGI